MFFSQAQRMLVQSLPKYKIRPQPEAVMNGCSLSSGSPGIQEGEGEGGRGRGSPTSSPPFSSLLWWENSMGELMLLEMTK